MRTLRLWNTARLAAVISVLAVVLAACGSGSTGGSALQGPKPLKQGGTLVIAAEQEGECGDVIGTCAQASWGFWHFFAHVLPRIFDVVDFKYRPSELMAEAPTLEAGPPMKVTYKFKPEAVWSDGTPITSADVKFTWEEIMTGKDISSKLGYDKIQSIDTPDPQTTVLTFKEPYAAWRDLFSPFYAILPAHILKGKDRNREMVNGFTWSAGPWKMESWTKGQNMTLVRNDAYWGKKPLLDKVVFQFILDQAAELQAFKTGQVQAIHPQESTQIRQQLQAVPNAKYQINPGTNLEGLWFNARKAPLDSKNVRQAIAYAIDREAIVQQFMRPIMPEAQVLQALAQPSLPTYSPAFERYKPDQAKVDQLMQADGWAKGADGIWAKDGKKAELEISTTAGNQRRELVEQLIQSQLKTAGFNLKINNTQAGTLFGTWLPAGRHMLAMYAQVLTPHPGLYQILGSDQVPSPANKNSGQNFQFYGSPAIDQPWSAVETELDTTKQAELVQQGNAALAEEVPLIPLYLRATILAVDGSKVGGPFGTNPTMGPFWNMYEWGLL